MTWSGSIALDGDVRGTLHDRWGWAIGLTGRRIGANRVELVASVAEAGEAPPFCSEAEMAFHEKLAGSPVLTGEIVRTDAGWAGSLGDALRLVSKRAWRGDGPVGLRGEPV